MSASSAGTSGGSRSDIDPILAACGAAGSPSARRRRESTFAQLKKIRDQLRNSDDCNLEISVSIIYDDDSNVFSVRYYEARQLLHGMCSIIPYQKQITAISLSTNHIYIWKQFIWFLSQLQGASRLFYLDMKETTNTIRANGRQTLPSRRILLVFG